MLLVEVPATWTYDQGRDFIVQFVFLASRIGELQSTVNRSLQIDLSLDLVEPVGAVGIFQVCHENSGSGVHRVDHHLGFDRTGDLATSILQVVW